MRYIYTSIVAMLAFAGPSLAQAATTGESYLEVRILNHQNNKHSFGHLYLFMEPRQNNLTNIPLVAGATSKCNGLGYLENGTGVSYLVDDYIAPRSGGKESSNSEMPYHGSPWGGATQSYPYYRGFKIPYQNADLGGVNIDLGFGCQIIASTPSDLLQYLHEHQQPNDCLDHDLFPLNKECGCILNACFGYRLIDGMYGANEPGFNQFNASLELAYNGLADIGDVTLINEYGFSTNVHAYANVRSQGGHFTEDGETYYFQAGRRMSANRTSIENQWKEYLQLQPETDWVVTDQGLNTAGHFRKAVGPNHWVARLSSDLSTCPAGTLPHMLFPTHYLAALNQQYPSATQAVTIEHPIKSTPSTPEDCTRTLEFDSSPSSDMFKGILYFPEDSNGDVEIIAVVKLILGDKDTGANLIGNYARIKNAHTGHKHPSSPSEVEEVRFTVPFKAILPVVVSGDPVHGVKVDVKFKSRPDTWYPWNYSSDDGTTHYKDEFITHEEEGEKSYLGACKGVVQQISTGLAFGWFGSYKKVRLCQVDGIGDIPAGAGWFYLPADTAEENCSCQAISTNSLSGGQQLYLSSIFAYEDHEKNSKPYYEPNTYQMAKWTAPPEVFGGKKVDHGYSGAYFHEFSDSWIWGNPAFNLYYSNGSSHRTEKTILWVVIPELGCTADFDNSGQVEIVDILHVLRHWEEVRADLDGDFVTGITDLILAINQFGSCTPIKFGEDQ